MVDGFDIRDDNDPDNFDFGAGDCDEVTYEYREIGLALRNHPEDELLTLKIMGHKNATRWLSVTPEQVRQIREILG